MSAEGSTPAIEKSLRDSFIYWNPFTVLSHIINDTFINIYVQDRCSQELFALSQQPHSFCLCMYVLCIGMTNGCMSCVTFTA